MSATKGTYVPLVFASGEAFQFDWSEYWVVIGGERTKLQVAHFKLCHSRAFMLRAYLLQNHEMLFEAEFCNPAAGWEKGQVEKNVRDSRYRIWHDAPSFKTLADLNTWLEQRCKDLWKDLWKEIAHPEYPSRMVADVGEDGRKQLMAVPAPFDGYVDHTKRVSSTCLILCDRNRYSVPAAFANKPVSVRAYAGRIVVVAEAHVVTEHTRVFFATIEMAV